jgi:hypothetical protein
MMRWRQELVRRGYDARTSHTMRSCTRPGVLQPETGPRRPANHRLSFHVVRKACLPKRLVSLIQGGASALKEVPVIARGLRRLVKFPWTGSEPHLNLLREPKRRGDSPKILRLHLARKNRINSRPSRLPLIRLRARRPPFISQSQGNNSPHLIELGLGACARTPVVSPFPAPSGPYIQQIAQPAHH